MAKRSRKKLNRREYARTSETFFSSLTRPLALPRLIRDPRPVGVARRFVEDRRLYDPRRSFRPARMVDGRKAGPLVAGRSPSGRPAFLSPRVEFPDPKRTLVCVRRQERKEVLFAKKLTRRGSGGGKRRTWLSDIVCRRT